MRFYRPVSDGVSMSTGEQADAPFQHHANSKRIIDITDADEGPQETTANNPSPEIHCTNSPGETAAVLYLRQNQHRLNGSEQIALNSMLQKFGAPYLHLKSSKLIQSSFFDDFAFRQTVVENGPTTLNASMTTAVRSLFHSRFRSFRQFLNGKGSREDMSPIGITFSAPTWSPVRFSADARAISRRPKYFRFLDLPPEIRVMIAKYALTRPRGLYWKWKDYRTTPKTATLGEQYGCGGLHVYNALSGTCKTTYLETRGIFLSLNTIHFDWRSMHKYNIPKRCKKQTKGRSAEAEGILEAFEVFQRSGFVKQLSIAIQCVFHIDGEYCVGKRLPAYIPRFQSVSLASPTTKLVVEDLSWHVNVPTKRSIDRVILPDAAGLCSDDEEGDEPERSMAQQRRLRRFVQRFLKRGKDLQALLERSVINKDDRKWRFLPSMDHAIRRGFEVESCRALLSESDYDLLQSLINYGV